MESLSLTEVAGEGGPHLAPQKFLLSQQFRYLMRCKKYLEKFFLSCLVSEIQLFVCIFGRNSKWPPEVRKYLMIKINFGLNLKHYTNFNYLISLLPNQIELSSYSRTKSMTMTLKIIAFQFGNND